MVDQATATPTDGEQAVNRKARVGTVVSDRNDKTIVVSVERTARHRLYRKVIRRSKKYHVHDEGNEATVGDLVRIEECRPYSRLKHWRLVEILTEREVAEVAPEELDEELVDEVQRSAARAQAEAEEAAAEADEEAGDGEASAELDPRRTQVPEDAAPASEVVEAAGDPDAAPVAQSDEAQPDQEQPPAEAEAAQPEAASDQPEDEAGDEEQAR
jgi:small subunit ribosomal protein S17